MTFLQVFGISMIVISIIVFFIKIFVCDNEKEAIIDFFNLMLVILMLSYVISI